MKANKFIVAGLAEPHKISDIEHSISSHAGINAVRVDLKASTITVDYDEARYSEGDIKNFVTQTGYDVIQVK